ncbi:Scr1 family TA system antitoxin-like transcriptional regulator [Actinoplanes sp. NPDC000266]
MTDSDAPAIARLRIRIALREAREAAGLTQAQVAEAMECSLSKIARFENGDTALASNDLRGLLGIRDRDRVNALLTDARTARNRPPAAWWQAFLARTGSVRLRLVLDESALFRPVGGTRTLADQLRRLVELAEQGNIGMRMLPYDSDIAVARGSGFDILRFGPDRASPEVVYRDGIDTVVESRAGTSRHRALFEQLWAAAASLDTIRRRIADLG